VTYFENMEGGAVKRGTARAVKPDGVRHRSERIERIRNPFNPFTPVLI